MKKLRKIGAIVLAVMMIAAVGLAYATSADDTYTGSGDSNAITGTGNRIGETTIPLTKGIIFFNANGSAVYEPNITFNYTVAPDTALDADGTTATVTDDGSQNNGTPVTRNVYPGPANGVTGTSITFSSGNDAHTTAADGAEVEHSGNLTFDASKFDRPGIYRYVITESVDGSGTDAEKLAAAGLTARDANYTTTRYLDVYVRNGDSGFEMYGAVIFVSTGSTPGTDSIGTNTEKTTGFQPGVGGASSYASDPNVDKYTTYDFTVKKTVSGSMADKNHDFPFYVTVSNTISGAKYTYTNDAGTAAAETISGTSITKGSGSTSSDLKLKHNEQISFVGVPSSQATDLAIVSKEYNDTYDQYTASTTAKNGTLNIANTNDADPVVTNGVMTATTGSMITESFDIVSNDDDAQVLTIDNNLTEISPTGYVSRFAPYALILIGGIALLIISKKHKKHTDEE